MNIITFQYTKDDKSTSNRVLAVMVKPNTMYEGLDLSELSEEEQGAAADACTQAYSNYLFALGAAEEQFDLKYRYRRFNPTKMADIVVDAI